MDQDDDRPHWAEHSTYPTEGQAMVAARSLQSGGYRTRIRTVRTPVASPKTYVLWVRDPEAQVKNWKDGGRFDTEGEAVAAERAARQAGLEVYIAESQNGRTGLPPIQVPSPKKRALLYQVMVFRYRNLSEGDWEVVYETFDPGAANERAIQIRTNQDPLPAAFYGPGHQYNPQTPVRVSSKEVMVDEATYRKSFPEYRR
jgi:hypothetical protein